MNDNFKSGFITIIGRPSSGKSTLINCICGYKISIISKQPQTTRFTVRGIYTDDDSQMIFIDTPGYHHFSSFLNKGLSELAVKTLDDGDLVLYLVDSSREFGSEEEELTEIVSKYKDKCLIVFNKIDVAGETPGNNYKEVMLRLPDVENITISALHNKNVNKLLELIKGRLACGPMFYPEDYVTDQSIPFRISEIVREKVFLNTQEEVPHSIYVEVDDLDVTERKITAHASIVVDKESQKGIVIGSKGTLIKKIGEDARKDLIDIFERNVNLFLKVKVHNNWKKNEKFIKKFYNLDYNQ